MKIKEEEKKLQDLEIVYDYIKDYLKKCERENKLENITELWDNLNVEMKTLYRKRVNDNERF